MKAEGLEKAKAWLESHNSKSGVVIRHGRIVAEWYFGDANRQTKFAALGRWDNNIFVAPCLDLIVIRQSDLAPPPKTIESPTTFSWSATQ